MPDSDLDEFNRHYSALSHYASNLSRTDLNASTHECYHLLQGIFDSLEQQTQDTHEREFISELSQECSRLFLEEVAWHSKMRLHRSFGLSSSASRLQAIQMQAERHVIDQLPSPVVQELLRVADHDVLNIRAQAQAGRLTREDLSRSSGPIIRKIRDILNHAFKALGTLDVLGTYTGRHIRVTGVSLELSVPQATWWKNSIHDLPRAPETLYAHLDETISCPKAIVYLTDVDELNGPTGYYPLAYENLHLNPLQEMIGRIVGMVGTRSNSSLNAYYAKQYHQSVNSENFRRHYMRLPESLRFNSHIGWDIMPGSLMEQSLVDSEKKMIGPAGTFIAFDGARLLHRGGMVRERERLALQVIFSDKTLLERSIAKARRVLS